MQNIDFYKKRYRNPQATDKRMKKIREVLLNIDKNKTEYKILDAGCGEGTFITYLKTEMPKSIIEGCELSKEGIIRARSKGIKVKICDLNKKMPYKNNSFDIIIAGEVIEHLYNLDNFLEESRRLLKKGGHLIITTPNLAAWYNRLLLFLGFQPFFLEISTKNKNLGRAFLNRVNLEKEPLGHIRVMTLRGLSDLVNLNGFKIKKRLVYVYLLFLLF